MDYDIILIHPPAIYDFWTKPTFPGPIAYSVGESTELFIIPPIGMFSIAEYLHRNHYKVYIDNLCERIAQDHNFDPESYISCLSSRVYAIGLHWCVHSQGAIETARLCKKLHPNSIVTIGGLTATVFHREIIQKYEFIDCVIRGEAEKPFLSFMKSLDKGKRFEEVPNLTFRDNKNQIKNNVLMDTVEDLDEFEFTSFDLIEPKRSIFTPLMPPHWSIPICRGCSYNCHTCGGSAHSYNKYLGRKQPAFRSPKKIVEDLQKLSKQGIEIVLLFQDPRMGGEVYWRNLFKTLREETIELTQLTMELFSPADEVYLSELAKIGLPITLTISPESCVDSVRMAHGRTYSNEELFRFMKLTSSFNIPLGIHSMIPLSNDNEETIKKNWDIWEDLCIMSQQLNSSIRYAFGPLILLDPGSLAFDYPESFGYQIIFKNLQDYVRGISSPSWHQWISYETKHLEKNMIAKLILDSIDQSISLREKYGIYTSSEAHNMRLYFVNSNKLVIDVVNNAMNITNEDERQKSLWSLRKYLYKNIPHLEFC